MPSPINHDGNFSLSLSCFKDFSITEELQTHQLLSINTVQRKPDESLLDKLDSFTERVAKLFVNPNIGVDMALLLQLLEGFVHPQMDQILFKQFPDGEGVRAVYQAVTHSPSQIKRIHEFKLLGNAYQMKIQHLDSFPLAQMFGLKLSNQSLYLPFYINMDFDQLSATQLLPTLE